jgi:hypothetical protein
LGTFWLKIEQFWPFEEISIFSNSGHLEWRGFSVPNKGELEAETLTNTATAFSSFLKLQAAGSRNQSNGNLNDRSVDDYSYLCKGL